MKILYAVQGTGNGHLSRAMAVVPELMKFGEVDVLISGTQSQITFPFPIKFRYQGLSFIASKSGGVNILKTLLITRPFRFWREIRSLPVADYDLVLTDFEPISAWACRLKGIPCIEMSHQAAVRNSLSPQTTRPFPLGRWIVKNYCPSSSALGFHFESYSDNTYLPILRREIIEAVPTQGTHYVVYLTGYNDAAILRILTQVNVPFVVFSKEVKQSIQQGNCILKPISNEVFLNDLLHAKGVICGAGFELPAEALYLKKKLLVIPYSNHYEQHCNAEAVKRLGARVLYSLGQKEVSHIQDWCAENEPVTYEWKDTLSLAVQRVITENLASSGATAAKKAVNL